MSSDHPSCQTLENTSLENVPITQQQYNDILNIQQEILAMLASHGKATDILARLCSLAESLLSNSVASVMMVNPSSGLMSVLSAPSVPQVGHDALANLKPGPGGGSCGNAVFNNEPQYVLNTFEDPRWTDIRQIAYDFNLCSCWSMPIRNEEHKAVGSFALSSFEHRSPAPFHQKLLETGAAIVNIVLRNQADEERIRLMSTAMENASDGMIITDKNNNIVEVNRAFETIYGYKEEQVLHRNPKIFGSGKHDEQFYQQMWDSLKATAKWSGEIINKRADGSEFTQWMSISTLYNAEGKVQNYLCIFSDLTELKKSQEQAEYLAFHDSLTQLKNKTHLERSLAKGGKYSLILFNVNNFSYINGAYGFEFGDILLIEVANILNELFGQVDECRAIYRINSDEYALLFDGHSNIKSRIEQIQNYFYISTLTIDDVTLNISFTYGAAYGCSTLLRNSALALKQAKESGKNRYHIFNEQEDTIAHSDRQAFIQSNSLLHHALDEGQVIPYFQGIYDNRSEQINRYEVLVRINNNGEIISPLTFLEPARLSGLLPEITRVMIDKSFQIMSANQQFFSINITEDDLSRSYLCDYLDAKSNQYGIEPKRVILEILEGVSSSGKKNHLAQLNALKSRGYAIAIDDFGAEYSNFERILDLDIDYLKIDAKYIKDIHTNPKSYEITRAIAYFAQNAGIPCIAEFVHCEAVQQVVKALGIDFSQGYYFSEPASLPTESMAGQL